jgi:hypothetical protein
LDWSESVCDIREQYPLLPLEETQEIAEQCGFTHPTNPATQQSVVMTTDFLITIKGKNSEIEHARAIKPSSELKSSRTLEKLEIERLYWEKRGTNWGIVTEIDIPEVFVKNINWVHRLYERDDLKPLSQADIVRIESFLRPQVIQGKCPLTKLTNDCDDKLGLDPGSSLSVVRHLIANKCWQVNMQQPIKPGQVLQLLPDQIMEDSKVIGGAV